MKKLVAGIIIGGLLFSGVSALAETNVTISNLIKFKFNGIEKKLPSGYSVLVYDGRTYVPSRFVAEELGAEVTWNESEQTVNINKKVEAPENKLPKEESQDDQGKNEEANTDGSQNQDSEKPNIVYDNLPVSQTVDGVRVEVYSVSHEGDATRLFFNVKNTNEAPYQLEQDSAYIEADKVKYKHIDVTNQLYLKDKNWFNDILKDENKEGFILLPSLPLDGEREGTLHLKVRKNVTNPQELNYQFNIKW